MDAHAALPTEEESASAAEQVREPRSDERQKLKWLAEVNATVAALVERISRRVNRTDQRYASLVGTGGER